MRATRPGVPTLLRGNADVVHANKGCDQQAGGLQSHLGSRPSLSPHSWERRKLLLQYCWSESCSLQARDVLL